MTTEDSEHLTARLRFIANTSISASSLRNQGGEGVVAKARCFMGELDLAEAGAAGAEGYPAYLDDCTAKLMAYFPDKARENYGAARKALNIYLFACTRDHVARSRYSLDRIEPALELPIDKDAITYLKCKTQCEASRSALRGFDSIKGLCRKKHATIQAIASEVAEGKGVLRCELDFCAWRPSKKPI